MTNLYHMQIKSQMNRQEIIIKVREVEWEVAQFLIIRPVYKFKCSVFEEWASWLPHWL